MQVTPEKAARAAPRLTHPDRVLYPELGITKLDLARYYAEVAPFLLPHAAGRPLTLVRCPRGRTGPSFFQKHPGRGTPEAIQRVPVRESGGVADSMVIADAEGLAGLVQLGALEIHAWGSRARDLEHPDQLTFDLDPGPGVPWRDVVAAARAVRDRLLQLGLQSFAKTTGGKGLHVVAPIAPRASWDQAKAFARALALELVAREPDRYLAKASKTARRGRIFLDYLRNARGATAICPYSTRAREGAPVATPVAWSEVTARLEPARFTLLSVPRRLAKLARDPWEGYTKVRQSLPALR